MAIRAIGVGLGFITVILIGRTWGPEGSGIYGLVSQTAMFVSIMAIGGLDLATVRALTGVHARGNRVAYRSIAAMFMLVGALVALPAIAILYGGAAWLTDLLNTNITVTAMIALVVMLVARSIVRMVSAVLRAQHHYRVGQFVDGMLVPALFCAVLLLGLAATIEELVGWMTVSGIAAIAIGFVLLAWTLHRNRSIGIASEAVSALSLFRSALPLWGVTIALNFADWYGLTVVTAQLGIAEAGIYRVVMQFSTTFSILSTGLFGVYSARIGAAQSQSDWTKVARELRSATWLSAALVIPPAMVLLMMAEPALGFVGTEFRGAAPALQLALVAQIIYIILGPAGLTLAMTGNARINLAITLASTLGLVFAAPWAASEYGSTGVVACISVLLVLRNLASLAFVRMRLGINALTGRYYPLANR